MNEATGKWEAGVFEAGRLADTATVIQAELSGAESLLATIQSVMSETWWRDDELKRDSAQGTMLQGSVPKRARRTEQSTPTRHVCLDEGNPSQNDESYTARGKRQAEVSGERQSRAGLGDSDSWPDRVV